MYAAQRIPYQVIYQAARGALVVAVRGLRIAVVVAVVALLAGLHEAVAAEWAAGARGGVEAAQAELHPGPCIRAHCGAGIRHCLSSPR